MNVCKNIWQIIQIINNLNFLMVSDSQPWLFCAMDNMDPNLITKAFTKNIQVFLTSLYCMWYEDQPLMRCRTFRYKARLWES